VLKINGPVDVRDLALLGAAEEIADQPGDRQARGGTELVEELFVLFWNGCVKFPVAGLPHLGSLRPHLLGFVRVLSGTAGAALVFGQSILTTGSIFISV